MFENDLMLAIKIGAIGSKKVKVGNGHLTKMPLTLVKY